MKRRAPWWQYFCALLLAILFAAWMIPKLITGFPNALLAQPQPNVPQIFNCVELCRWNSSANRTRTCNGSSWIQFKYTECIIAAKSCACDKESVSVGFFWYKEGWRVVGVVLCVLQIVSVLICMMCRIRVKSRPTGYCNNNNRISAKELFAEQEVPQFASTTSEEMMTSTSNGVYSITSG